MLYLHSKQKHNVVLVHHLDQALKAEFLFKREKEYVVRDGEIVIVDENTGRLMFGRRYNQGLHQAIEAKEKVTIQRESKTLATTSASEFTKKEMEAANEMIERFRKISNTKKQILFTLGTNNGLKPNQYSIGTVAKVIELTAGSTKSIEDAVENGIAKADNSLDNIESVWLQEIKGIVKNGKVSEWRVNMKVTFLLK